MDVGPWCQCQYRIKDDRLFGDLVWADLNFVLFPVTVNGDVYLFAMPLTLSNNILLVGGGGGEAFNFSPFSFRFLCPRSLCFLSRRLPFCFVSFVCCSSLHLNQAFKCLYLLLLVKNLGAGNQAMTIFPRNNIFVRCRTIICRLNCNGEILRYLVLLTHLNPILFIDDVLDTIL